MDTTTQQLNSKLSLTDKVLVALGLLGTLFMSYLLYLHFRPTDSALCNFGEGFSCEVVNQSLYSDVLGIPLSALGIVYFLSVAFLSWAKPLPNSYRWIQMFTIFSLVFGVSLTYLEVQVIGSICVFCESSKAVMLAIFGVSTVREKKAGNVAPWPWFAVAIGVGLLFVMVTRYLQENFY